LILAQGDRQSDENSPKNRPCWMDDTLFALGSVLLQQITMIFLLIFLILPVAYRY